MFERTIRLVYAEWAKKADRKPLIVRGARQVGKTHSVVDFAKRHFKFFIHLNLDKKEHLDIFEKNTNLADCLKNIEILFNQKIILGETLLFIDEIQNSGKAMQQLRYFYEETPTLHVMAAGSLLEVKIKQEGFSFPVGRVEYLYLQPVSFEEFLNADGQRQMLELINTTGPATVISEPMHALLLKKYQEYALVGGMPEAVAEYLEQRSLVSLDTIYESILTGFEDDIAKYVGMAKAPYLRHVLQEAPKQVGKHVTYHQFGQSDFKSREMKEAFDTLERAMVVQRIGATSSLDIPLLRKPDKSPKLIFLDMALVRYRLGLKKYLEWGAGIDFDGQMAEQLVGQTLLTLDTHRRHEINYWYRNQPGSTAEVDFVLTLDGTVVASEVKAGKTGKLKSLHLFMEATQHAKALRIYHGPLRKETVLTSHKKKVAYYSLPFYLLHRVREFV